MSRVGGYVSKAVARDWFSDGRTFEAARLRRYVQGSITFGQNGVLRLL